MKNDIFRMIKRRCLWGGMALVCFPLTMQAETMTTPETTSGDSAAYVRHPWYGKRVGYIGDSITDPNCFGTDIRKYWEFLKDWLAITPYVYGVSGRQWDDVPRQTEKLHKEHGDEVDAILVFMGTNDFNHSVPMGQWYTEQQAKVMAAEGNPKALETRTHRTFCLTNDTFRGRINLGLSRLKALYPDKQIVLLTPLHRSAATFGEKNVQPDENYQNKCGLYIDAYVQAVKEAGSLWGVPVIDMNAMSGLNPMVTSQLPYFHDASYDRLHPSTKGQERLSRTLMYQLLALPVF